MYVITFYSFKGGVGRTFALVNVAAELARRGRKVLLVDFDLEAPGLETFVRLRPPEPRAGVVEYVKEYLYSKQSPDVREYTYSAEWWWQDYVFSEVGKKGGQIWVMPAGRRDVKYQAALASIDWKRLYHDCQGYWFFEDTKKQWEEAFQPDYVLIDSRTGHTDVEGICTRQLPDAVVVLFFPNEQNLAGLRDVCRRIRGERASGLMKDIRLHFVMSNVPDLDDEDKVLRRRVEAFRTDLGIERLDVIHRYESAALFNQAVFVLDRPRSRLAREYRRLWKTLVVENPADRDGALLFLRQWAQSCLPEVARDVRQEVDRRLGVLPLGAPAEGRSSDRGVEVSGREPEDPLNRIAKNFLDDADLLARIAECRMLKGEFKKASAALDRVLQLQPNLAQAVFERAMCRNRLGDQQGAVEDMMHYLQLPGLEGSSVVQTLRQLRAIAPNRIGEAIVLPVVQQLPPDRKYEVAKMLAERDEDLPLAIQMVRGCFTAEGRPGADEVVSATLLYITVALGVGLVDWKYTAWASLFQWLLRAGRTKEALDMIEPLDPPMKLTLVKPAIKDADSPEVIQLLRGCVTAEEAPPDAWVSLFYCQMRAKRWEEAIQTLADNGITAEGDEGLFFLAMAQWGRTGRLPEDLFRRALARYRERWDAPPRLDDRIIAECLMNWAVGNRDEAIRILVEKAYEHTLTDEPLFSFWGFRHGDGDQYLEDCSELRRMILGEPIRPAFLGDPPAPTPG
jgi:MinD-like ATPase involved in chromosome partitioning or flagellar assembly